MGSIPASQASKSWDRVVLQASSERPSTGRLEGEARAVNSVQRIGAGSPQLNSFGPSMSFAREMLEAGEREPVLEYLNLCRSFWKGDEGRLDRWTREIKEGRIPDFGPSLLR
ncbi:MAG TPA: hypothetical protein VKF17_06415 [Isosphaeraceae bacterium]|nr:hypothetical protein [Isosphaeraceae bacterium]